MVAELINGKLHAQHLRDEILQGVESLHKSFDVRPKLVVIMVGESLASQIYVRNKLKACQAVGIEAFLVHLSETISQQELVSCIELYNKDPRVHGILLQLPLPSHLQPLAAVMKIAPEKDVDGLHPYNQGLLFQGHPRFIPCTPQGCLQLIKTCTTSIAGKNAIIIGRSILVGRPMAALLLNENATVVMAHSHTANLKELSRNADIVIAAIGQANYITGEFIKKGAIVIDVGINRLADNQLVGDVDAGSAAKEAGFITPVPGGVGPMTIANLLYNTLKAAVLSVEKDQ